MLAALVVPSPASADPIEDFYRGKQIKLYVRAAPGGNYDVYSRILGRHITRFIPGNPNVMPINMPGGGGIVALNYVANVAPRDGTVLTMITQSFPMDQALGLDKTLKVDLRTLNWIGNMSDTNEFFFTAKNSPTKTLDDARRRETVIAATGVGSIVTRLAALYNNTLGTKFKVIYGYPSGPDMTLALERGEVEGRSTSNPQVLGPTQGRRRSRSTTFSSRPGCERSLATRKCRCFLTLPGPMANGRSSTSSRKRPMSRARSSPTPASRRSGWRRCAAPSTRRLPTRLSLKRRYGRIP